MSVEIVENKYHKVLICNTTDNAFGPVFSADDDVEGFLLWLGKDVRTYPESEIMSWYYKYDKLMNDDSQEEEDD